jgi:hypothetical protein
VTCSDIFDTVWAKICRIKGGLSSHQSVILRGDF